MSLIENSLEKLRRATGKESQGAAPTPFPGPSRADPVATRELRPLHRRIAVDPERLRGAGYLPELGQERRFAEYCHRIKRPVIDRALAPGNAADSRLILLSSALPGDGKSFIALNLALSMARERDISLLLVDGDLPKAQISRVLGVRDHTGLVDALKDDAVDIESLVLDTDVANLEVLPAGRTAEGMAELVSSNRMREIATRLISRHPRRVVLFDSAPLLVSSEARALLPIVGQVVLVTRARHTPRRAIAEAIALVDKSKLQGLVLNDAVIVGPEHAYYDYYGESGEPSKTA